MHIELVIFKLVYTTFMHITLVIFIPRFSELNRGTISAEQSHAYHSFIYLFIFISDQFLKGIFQT